MQKTWKNAGELALAMEARALADRNVILSPATALWMARQIQNAIARNNVPVKKSKFDIDIYASGSCILDIDAGGGIIEVVAWAQNSLVAKAAFREACERYPTQKFQQRRRSWVELES